MTTERPYASGGLIPSDSAMPLVGDGGCVVPVRPSVEPGTRFTSPWGPAVVAGSHGVVDTEIRYVGESPHAGTSGIHRTTSVESWVRFTDPWNGHCRCGCTRRKGSAQPGGAA